MEWRPQQACASLGLGARLLTEGKAGLPQSVALPSTPSSCPPGLLHLVSGQLHGVRKHIRPEVDNFCVPSRPWGPVCIVLPFGDPKRECMEMSTAAAADSGSSSPRAAPRGGLLPAEGSLPPQALLSRLCTGRLMPESPSWRSVESWSSAQLGVRRGRDKREI